MSRARPITAGRARPTNLAVSMREAFTALNDLVLVRLAERGHEPDPHDRRAKLVLPTERGREVIAIAQDLVPHLEEQITAVLGAERVEALRADLDTIREIATS